MPHWNVLQLKTSDEPGNKVQATLSFLKGCGKRTEKNIERMLAECRCDATDETLFEAIRYSVFSGGKRIRPGLVYAAARLLEVRRETVDPIACAIELIHCYSLIHDDLPAMDDDDMRRGKPSCHRAFGEAIAILAGDAMQAMAFECLSSATLITEKNKNKICRTLAQVAGIAGMASGQAMDFTLGKDRPPAGRIEQIHRLKTGALMAACIVTVLHCAPRTPKRTAQNLSDYAADIGLCFQIRDDILDAEHDAGCEKHSYVAIYGKDASRMKLQQIHQRCLASLEPFGQAARLLRDITHYIATRDS